MSWNNEGRRGVGVEEGEEEGGRVGYVNRFGRGVVEGDGSLVKGSLFGRWGWEDGDGTGGVVISLWVRFPGVDDGCVFGVF